VTYLTLTTHLGLHAFAIFSKRSQDETSGIDAFTPQSLETPLLQQNGISSVAPLFPHPDPPQCTFEKHVTQLLLPMASELKVHFLYVLWDDDPSRGGWIETRKD